VLTMIAVLTVLASLAMNREASDIV
jgi:hypothetical protein